MTRLNLATDLKTRTGAPDKDARIKNAYVETRDGQSVVRKRPIAQGGISVATVGSIAQGGIGFTNYSGGSSSSGLFFLAGDTQSTYTGDGTTWNVGTNYVIGDHVTKNWKDYWAIDNNIANDPSVSPAHWSTTYVPAVPSIFPSAWTARTLNASGLWDFITYGTKFIVSSNSASYQYSTDGISWATGTNASTIGMTAYGNSVYLAMASGGGSYTKSSDGISWSAGSFSGFIPGYVYFANGLFFVCTATVGGWQYKTSADGTTWSAVINTIADIGSGGVVYGAGKYVAADFNGFVKPLYYSSDAVNWTQATCANASAVNQLCFGNGVFMVLYSGSQYGTSTDGINWTTRTTPSTGITNIAFGNGYFCMVKSGNSYVSADGIAWSPRTFPLTDVNPMPLAYGGGKFVTVKYNTNSGASLA